MRPNPRFCVVPAPPHGAGAVGGAVALATGAVAAVVLPRPFSFQPYSCKTGLQHKKIDSRLDLTSYKSYTEAEGRGSRG